MSNEENISNQKKLTPQELAKRLDIVILDILDAVETGNAPKWAKEAVERFKQRKEISPYSYSRIGVMLTIEQVKTLCPELYEQVINPAMEIAKSKTTLYTPPRATTLYCFRCNAR
jgi:hypothetical protein